MNPICPLHCQTTSPDQVEWAGLPINLDMAFSTKQRDKVYVQHVKRRQSSQLRLSQLTAAPCVCASADERGYLASDSR
jgi:hypothetical protein